MKLRSGPGKWGRRVGAFQPSSALSRSRAKVVPVPPRLLIRALAFLLALYGGRVDAGVYVVVNATTTFATFAACNNQCQAATIVAGTTGGPASTVTPQVIVTNAGACTAQIIGSNDKTLTNWENVGSAIAVTAGNVHGGLASGASLNATWQYWSAIITTLTAGATCTVTISG